MPRRVNTVIILLILLPGLAFRLIIAPYTAGSDIPQFAGFADTFLRHGLGFYMYSDGSRAGEEGWAYGWPYVYGPLFILLLAPLRIIAPGRVDHYWVGSTYYVYAPMDWIMAVKSLYIFFDTLVAVLIYLFATAMGLGEKRSLAAMILYYYNPMTIYISSIYGMFDQIPLFFLLLGLYLYMYKFTSRWWKAASVTSTAASIGFKPTMIYPLIIILLDYLLRHRAGRGLVYASAVLLLAAGFYAPFFLYAPPSLWIYLKAVRSVSSPTYASPIVYTFNGFTAIAFYAWEHAGYDFTGVTKLWPLVFISLYILVLLGYLYERKTLKYTGLAYITYTASYWRVNFQYLVPTTGFTVLLMLDDRRRFWTLFLGGVLLVVIGLWPLMYPVSWWAHVHIKEPAKWVMNLLDSASFMIFDELVYVYYAVFLTFTQIALVTCASLKEACSLAANKLSWLTGWMRGVITHKTRLSQ